MGDFLAAVRRPDGNDRIGALVGDEFGVADDDRFGGDIGGGFLDPVGPAGAAARAGARLGTHTLAEGRAALHGGTTCARARRPAAGSALLAFRKQVLEDGEHIAGGDKLELSFEHGIERHRRIKLLDELLDVREVDRTGNDQNAIGARIGDDLRFADDEIGFELSGGRAAEGGLDDLALGIDLRGAAGRAGLTR